MMWSLESYFCKSTCFVIVIIYTIVMSLHKVSEVKYKLLMHDLVIRKQKKLKTDSTNYNKDTYSYYSCICHAIRSWNFGIGCACGYPDTCLPEVSGVLLLVVVSLQVFWALTWKYTSGLERLHTYTYAYMYFAYGTYKIWHLLWSFLALFHMEDERVEQQLLI